MQMIRAVALAKCFAQIAGTLLNVHFAQQIACAVALISANFASLAVCSCCAACSVALSLFNFHAPLIQSWHSSGRASRVKPAGNSPISSIVMASPVSVFVVRGLTA